MNSKLFNKSSFLNSCTKTFYSFILCNLNILIQKVRPIPEHGGREGRQPHAPMGAFWRTTLRIQTIAAKINREGFLFFFTRTLTKTEP